MDKRLHPGVLFVVVINACGMCNVAGGGHVDPDCDWCHGTNRVVETIEPEYVTPDMEIVKQIHGTKPWLL